MKYANDVEGNRIDPFSFGRGYCPSCDSLVIAKCGSLNVHHWAHDKSSKCDGWNYEPITQWHLEWQSYFSKEQQEVVIVKGDEKHRADIVTKNNTVIEVQHSCITMSDVVKREEFYDRMIWIVNASEFISNLEIDYNGFDIFYYYGKFIHNFHGDISKQFRIDLPSDDRYGVIKRALEAKGYTALVKDGKQPTSYTNDRKHYNEILDKEIINAFCAYHLAIEFDKEFATKPDGKITHFVRWKHRRKCWVESSKPIFFDLNNGYLLFVKRKKDSFLDCRILQRQTVIDHYAG